MSFLEELSLRLKHEGERPQAPFGFQVAFSPDAPDRLQVSLRDPSCPPLQVTVSGPQLLVMVFLISESDIPADQRPVLNEQMLRWSVSMPLSSFGKIGGDYLLFGALMLDAAIEELLLEIRTLYLNWQEAGRLLKPYLRA